MRRRRFNLHEPPSTRRFAEIRSSNRLTALFGVVVDPMCLTSFVYPGARWRAGPGGTWRRVTWGQKLTVALALGATAYLAAKG